MFNIFKTIRGKLTIYFVTVFGLTLIVFCIVIYAVFSYQIKNDIDEALQVMASSTFETIKEEGIGNEISSEVKESYIPFSGPDEKFIEIIDYSGNTVFNSEEQTNKPFQLNKDELVKSLSGTKSFKTVAGTGRSEKWNNIIIRILLYPVTYNSQKYVIIAGVSYANMGRFFTRLRFIFYISIPFILILSTVMGWFFSRRAYLPINKIITEANSITAEKLNVRLPVGKTQDEISKLAETLNGMIERLEKSFLMQKQFNSDASHELKTPLTILKGEIEVALQQLRSSEEYKRILSGNLDEINRLQKIVESLLLLSQFENDKIQLHLEKINLDDLLIDAVKKATSYARKKNIRIVIKLDESKDTGEILINGDYAKLINVLLNIIDNAIKYSDNNSQIEITAGKTAQGTAIVSVKDSGIGINAEDIENIFGRFYRSKKSRTRDETLSLGLGLSIAKAVVEAHKGNISVKSTPRQGSAFTIQLPLFRG
jgi:two-component system OmpR family sensor kinase